MTRRNTMKRLMLSTSPRAAGIAAAAAAALALTAGPALAQPAGTIGVDAMIRNAVLVKPVGASAGRPAVLREAAHLGDAFTTGAQSSLQLLLRDRSVFTIGANARLTLDRFVYDPSRNSSDVAASVTRGAFRFMSGRSLSGQGQRAITTPVASIGVRGTIVEGAVGPDVAAILNGQPGVPPLNGDLGNATLIVLIGPGSNADGLDKPGAIDITLNGGGTISLTQPGQALLIFDGGGAPYGPFQISDSALGQLGGLLFPPSTPGGSPGTGFIGSVGLGSGDIGGGPLPPSFPTGAGGNAPTDVNGEPKTTGGPPNQGGPP